MQSVNGPVCVCGGRWWRWENAVLRTPEFSNPLHFASLCSDIQGKPAASPFSLDKVAWGTLNRKATGVLVLSCSRRYGLSCPPTVSAVCGKLAQFLPAPLHLNLRDSFLSFHYPQGTCLLAQHFLFPKRQDGWQPCSENRNKSSFMKEKKKS